MSADDRRRVSSGHALEDVVGYSRAVRVGDQIWVAGTTARGEDLERDAAGQAEAAIAIILDALAELGAGPADVGRTCLYVTDIADLEAVGRVHGAHFGDARPACTGLQVAKLTPGAAKVAIEVTAVASA
ncbi:MAG: Rid family hydrolase [Pseudomonadota bacterium]